MGLFSSSQIPQPPLPKITVNISSPPKKVFRPDDTVAGYIVFSPTVPIKARAIEVSLFGQSLVWHRTDTSTSSNPTDYGHWRDNAPLFEIVTNVLPAFHSNAPTLQPGDTCTYPFKFRFPASTGNSRFGQYKDDADTRWTVGPHLLPPSFLHTNRYGTNTGDDADYAEIAYGICARLVCPGVGVAKGPNLHDLRVTTPILFAPRGTKLNAHEHSPSVIRYPKTFTAQTSALTSQAGSSIGFFQSMRDHFSSSTPKLDFEVAIEVPGRITPGLEFRIRASFDVLSKSDKVSRIPPVHFVILKLELQDLTATRAPRDNKAGTTHDEHHFNNKHENMPAPDALHSKQEHVDLCKRKTPLNSLPDSKTLELVEVLSEDKKTVQQASSCGAWFTARVPGFTPPSFRSFSINRDYQVKIKLGIEVGGKKFEHEVRSEIREMRSAPR